MKKLIASVLVVLGLAGCAATGDSPITNDFVVTIATMKVIEGADDPVKKAERVIVIAEAARAVLATDGVILVSELEDRVVAAIDWDSLKPSDFLLAATLIETVSKDLQARVDGAGFLQGEQMVYASHVLTTVINAAERYKSLTEETQ